MKTREWLVVFFVCLSAVMISGCDKLLGPDPDEISPSDGLYIFELEYVRFQYDPGNDLMTVTNLTSVRSKIWIVRYDDRADERKGVRFTLEGFNSHKAYHEQFPRGTVIWVDVGRDGVHTTGCIEFR